MRHHALIALCFVFLYSCQDVVDVELEESPPYLVIEASIDWERGTDGSEQVVKLSTTKPYFDSLSTTKVTGATVTVTHLNSGLTFDFIDQGNGDYSTEVFLPVLGDEYQLDVSYQGERYRGRETMQGVADILFVAQTTELMLSTEDKEVTAIFLDPADERNFYLMEFITEPVVPFLVTLNDEFTDGNLQWFPYERSTFSEGLDFEPGERVDINMYGISETFYNYMTILLQQANGGGGGPFVVPPVPLKGNCQNLEDETRLAYGYFRLGQVSKTQYVVK